MMTEADVSILQMPRTAFPREKLVLPPASTPRPGDEVVWYTSATRRFGQYVGYGADAKPVVTNEFNVQARLNSYDALRLKKPLTRVGPNWTILDASCFICPLEPEREQFKSLMNRHIPPGPTYMELAEEIWGRGYEVYLVGGTVRDVIAGAKPNDVDLSTTMPLSRYRLLFESMFNKSVSIKEANGYARLGGKGKSGDPFIDLKIFTHGGVGAPDALFGSSFSLDLQSRDFACNALYYDPINEVIIDPSSRGLSDTSSLLLSIICDPQSKSAVQKGQIAIRYFKFLMRGYTGCPNSLALLQTEFLPCLAAMTDSHRLAYLNRQIFGKLPAAEVEDARTKLKDIIMEQADQLWGQLFVSILGEGDV